MALNKVTFNINTSGLGAPLISKDHISGLLYYNNTLPSGFSSSDRIKIIFSIEEAEALGIIEGSADHGAEWYHINEFFQKQPQGELHVGYYAEPTGAPTFAEVQTMQDNANGEIRQIGVYFVKSVFATSQVTALQTIAATLRGESKPLSILYGPDISATSDLSTLPDLRALNAPNVSVCIGQDGGAKGAALAVSTTKSITDLGAKLGAVSAANVNESISYYEKFPMVTDGSEFETAHFANGQAVATTASAAINAIDDKSYIFLVKEVGFSNTFNSDSYSSVSTTNDLATIENNRTIDKASRILRALIVPQLGSPLRVQADGTLREDTIQTFKALAQKALSQMEAAGEVSQYEVLINPSQNVVSTSTLEITCKIIPVGVAREIVINLGFTPNL
ncbi:Phage tail sheath protein [uncultured Mediterranean phage uvMED]|nr:Phage tail sheath protein [uncultured Mediterranean phage uvMED]BAR22578.1 Phage tail sheath protein [uncultured Mediterranean phage uvMED]